MFNPTSPIPYQTLAPIDGVQICVKRLDLVHPTMSGNKFFKLKYNLLEAKKLGYTQLLSFGGAYSNHIDALAHAAHDYDLQCIAFIRGEELQQRPLNPTLARVKALGCQLHFISRQHYRLKDNVDFLAALQQQFPQAYILPEGGTNALAVRGCEEILTEHDKYNFDLICCAVGTGGTISGIINASLSRQQVLGCAAVKADFLTKTIQQWTTKSNWKVLSEQTFGGYAKYDQRITRFIEDIYQRYQLPLEPIYTAKALYQLISLIHQKDIPAGCRVLFIHTGGLQAFNRDKINP